LQGDVVSLDILVTVDPDNVRGYGAGNGEVIVPYEAYGTAVKRFGLPDMVDGVSPENGVDIIPLVPLRSFRFFLYNEGKTYNCVYYANDTI
jgi:hypothetical protein